MSQWNPDTLAAARERDAAEVIRTLVEAGTVIREVSYAATRQTRGAPSCPHDNMPFYPSHAMWCDECWETFTASLAAARAWLEANQ